MSEKEFDYMNVVPLVDVMLVLLTIVLTTSTFIATGVIPVDLPQIEKSAKRYEKKDRKVIEINQEGEVFLNASKISMEDLQKSVGEFPSDTEVLIRADKKIALQKFVSVLELVKKQGLQQVFLQTEESI